MAYVSANSSRHVAIHAGSIILALITQIISAIFLVLAKEGSVPNALFQTSYRNISESYPLEVTIDSWSETYWIVIDLWSKAWLLYAVAGLVKRNVLGPESCNPEIHPPKFYLMWASLNLTRICSMHLWDQHFILAAVLCKCLLTVCSFCMLYISYSNLSKHQAWLAINNPSVIPWTRFLTHNGLAVFAWWTLLHAVVGLGMLLKYHAFVKDPLVSTIVLSVVFLCIVTWFTLQTFVFARHMRPTFSVYPTLMLGLGAMFTSSYRVQNLSVNTTICGVMMLLSAIMNFINSISACVENSRRPPAVKTPRKIRLRIRLALLVSKAAPCQPGIQLGLQKPTCKAVRLCDNWEETPNESKITF